VLQRASDKLAPGAINIPFLTVGATDARFFRRIGATAYGFGLLSERLNFDEFSGMFHGDNERVDQISLRLSTELWDVVARDLLG
jgi:acetylornithine deacetylase/succinyl-diaminopimelate desuccinylase-like protein